jgi:O-acetyl-ADP-ribose deacetylase (regulator of RNase III)
LARLILDATYDATLTAGRTNAQATGNSTVYLTLIGGGVFGNPAAWIVSAIERAIERHANSGLDVVIVSYGGPNARLSGLIDRKDVAGA